MLVLIPYSDGCPETSILAESSVLEVITNIALPRKKYFCTRFATEIVVLRDIDLSISCKITLNKARTEKE